MKPQDDKLTPKQEAALMALLAYPTLHEAAKSCGQSETTLWRFQQEPVFIRAYDAARRKAMEQALTTLQANCGDATRTLVSLFQDTGTPPAVRVSACRSVLEYAFKGSELIEMEQRLSALEEALDRPEGKAS